jgi:hypothetical protein
VLQDGGVRGTASVESWQGTVAELLNPIEEIQYDLGEALVTATVISFDGVFREFNSAAEVLSYCNDVGVDSILSIRVVCAALDGSIAATLVARPKVPGVILDVNGPGRSVVLGLTELAFQRMMIGYVDRLGAWRGAAWMATAIAPVLLISMTFSAAQAPWWVRLLVGMVAFGGSFLTLILTYSAFQFGRGFELVDKLPERRSVQLAVLLKRVKRNKRTRFILWVVGTLFLAVVGNKLSDLILWP